MAGDPPVVDPTVPPPCPCVDPCADKPGPCLMYCEDGTTHVIPAPLVKAYLVYDPETAQYLWEPLLDTKKKPGQT